MELGATVCTRRNPLCTVCPVRPLCAAARAGDPESYPALAAKKMEQRAVTRVWCVDQGRLLLHRAASGARRLSNLLELPEAEGLALQPGPETLIAIKRRTITRSQITESIYAITLSAALRKRIKGIASLEWVAWDQLEAVTLSGPHKRWIAELRVRHGG